MAQTKAGLFVCFPGDICAYPVNTDRTAIAFGEVDVYSYSWETYCYNPQINKHSPYKVMSNAGQVHDEVSSLITK